jgi:hypothetical protein
METLMEKKLLIVLMHLAVVCLSCNQEESVRRKLMLIAQDAPCFSECVNTKADLVKKGKKIVPVITRFLEETPPVIHSNVVEVLLSIGDSVGYNWLFRNYLPQHPEKNGNVWQFLFGTTGNKGSGDLDTFLRYIPEQSVTDALLNDNRNVFKNCFLTVKKSSMRLNNDTVRIIFFAIDGNSDSLNAHRPLSLTLLQSRFCSHYHKNTYAFLAENGAAMDLKEIVRQLVMFSCWAASPDTNIFNDSDALRLRTLPGFSPEIIEHVMRDLLHDSVSRDNDKGYAIVNNSAILLQIFGNQSVPYWRKIIDDEKYAPNWKKQALLQISKFSADGEKRRYGAQRGLCISCDQLNNLNNSRHGLSFDYLVEYLNNCGICTSIFDLLCNADPVNSISIFKKYISRTSAYRQEALMAIANSGNKVFLPLLLSNCSNLQTGYLFENIEYLHAAALLGYQGRDLQDQPYFSHLRNTKMFTTRVFPDTVPTMLRQQLLADIKSANESRVRMAVEMIILMRYEEIIPNLEQVFSSGTPALASAALILKNSRHSKLAAIADRWAKNSGYSFTTIGSGLSMPTW